MKYFSVKNFNELQHYRDRNPPWIKLYNRLLDDYEFGKLPDASKFHLLAIYLLASRSNNRIPYDPAWIAQRSNARTKVDLDILRDAGFLLINQPLPNAEQDASTTLAERYRETERETEQSREEKENTSAAPAALVSPKKKKSEEPFVLPDWIPEDHWNAWIEARTKSKHPPTDYAKRLAVLKLDNLREQGYPPGQVLMHAAFNNYSGLFPPPAPRN